MSRDESMIKVAPLAHLQRRKSEKWNAFPQQILPMPFAVMDFELAEPIKKVISDLIADSDAGYLGNIPELAPNYAAFAKRRWDWEVDPAGFRIAPDVGVAVIEVIRTLIPSGEKVMINTPVYFNFFSWISELGCLPFDVPLKAPREGESESRYRLDLEGIENGYKGGVKVHILCHPHNPVGAIYPKSDLIKLAELAHRYEVVVLSDEIHSPLVYERESFTPFLAASELAKEVGIAFVSATKAFSFAGLKCAHIIATSDATKRILDRLPKALHSRASLFGAVASMVAWKDCDAWLDQVINFLDSQRKLLASLIESELVGVGYKIPDAGYFGWLNLRKTVAQEKWQEIAGTLLEHGKIAVALGDLYGPGGAGFIRINFATSEEILRDAVARLRTGLARFR